MSVELELELGHLKVSLYTACFRLQTTDLAVLILLATFNTFVTLQ
jgi:hypothetical protein